MSPQMNALQIRGPFRGASGHDQHVREFVRALHHQGLTIQLVDINNWYPLSLTSTQQHPLFEKFVNPVDAKIRLHFCMPVQVKIARGIRNVNYTMFEASRIPKKWLRHNLRHNLVILPTESSRETWIDSGFPADRIRLCPLGVDPDVFRPEVPPMPLQDERGRNLTEYEYRFLNVSDFMPRKNLIGLLRVWITATNRTDSAVFILKINCGCEKSLQRFYGIIKEVETELGKTLKESAPVIFLVNKIIAANEMPALYTAATHYWSMSCGEGWDLAMTEAASSGLQLIAPAHSGYLTYLDETVAFMLPVRQVAAKFKWDRETERLFKGAEWWHPDEMAAVDILSRIIKRGEHSGDKKDARVRMLQHYTWEHAAKRLVNILEEI